MKGFYRMDTSPAAVAARAADRRYRVAALLPWCREELAGEYRLRVPDWFRPTAQKMTDAEAAEAEIMARFTSGARQEIG